MSLPKRPEELSDAALTDSDSTLLQWLDYYYKRAEFAIAALEKAEEQLRKQIETPDHIWFDVSQALAELKRNAE